MRVRRRCAGICTTYSMADSSPSTLPRSCVNLQMKAYTKNDSHLSDGCFALDGGHTCPFFSIGVSGTGDCFMLLPEVVAWKQEAGVVRNWSRSPADIYLFRHCRTNTWQTLIYIGNLILGQITLQSQSDFGVKSLSFYWVFFTPHGMNEESSMVFASRHNKFRRTGL